MRRIVAGMAVIVAAAFFGSAVHAQGMGGGCGTCSQGDAQAGQFRKFQQDTIDLRQEMMNKRYELQRENLKGNPDAARMAALKEDIRSLQAKINDIRAKSGLPERGKRDGECYKAEGDCGRKGQMGECGQPCGSGQPCGQQPR